MKLLMVCLGNICRSPLAEGIMQHKIDQQGLPWIVDSAGTSGGWHEGSAPHELSCLVALEKGIDISQQACRPLKREDFFEFDYIFVMDLQNYRDARELAGDEFNPDQTRLILNELFPGEDREVPDPWSRSIESYYEVYDMLDSACEKLIENLTKQTS